MLKTTLLAASALVAGGLSLAPARAQNYDGNAWNGANNNPSQAGMSSGYGGGPNEGYYTPNFYGGNGYGSQSRYGSQNYNQQNYGGSYGGGYGMGGNSPSQWSGNSAPDRRAMSGPSNYGGQGGASFQTNPWAIGGQQDRGIIVLLAEHDRQVLAMRDLRDQIRQAQQALQAGDKSRAEQALDEAAQTIRLATRSAEQGSSQQATGGAGANGGVTSVQGGGTAQAVGSSAASGPNGTGSGAGSLGSSAGTGAGSSSGASGKQ